MAAMEEKQIYSKIKNDTDGKMIAAYLIRDDALFLKLAEYLVTKGWETNSYFEDNKLQWIINSAFVYFDKYHAKPNKDILFSFADASVKDAELNKNLKAKIEEVFNVEYLPSNLQYVKDKAVEFIKRERAIVATYENSADIQNEKFEGLSERMAKAVNINLDTDLGTSLKDVKKCLTLAREVKDTTAGCSWGSTILDNSDPAKGKFGRAGLGRILPGELGFFAGVPGAGKTTWLQHLAVKNFLDGKKVILFSFEVSEQRLTIRFYKEILSILNGGKPMDLVNTPDDVIEKMLNNPNFGDIKIISKPSNSTSCNDMAAIIEDLKKYENFVPDLILIDYVLITSTNDKTLDSTNTYKYYKTVAEEMRNLAVVENAPVVSACQINRDGMGEKGGSTKSLSSKNLAESRGVLDTADYLLMIQQTADEKNLKDKPGFGKYRIAIDKNRNGANLVSVNFLIRWDTMHIFEVDENNAPIDELGV